MVLHCIALLTRLGQGGGILEADLERVWSYGYTTAAEATSRSDVARPCSKWAARRLHAVMACSGTMQTAARMSGLRKAWVKSATPISYAVCRLAAIPLSLCEGNMADVHLCICIGWSRKTFGKGFT